MECTVTIDERLLDEARRALGTDDVQTTIEVGLREAIRARAAPPEPPHRIRSDEELWRYLRDARGPRTAAEQARWDAAVAAADRHRVHVGPDFDVVKELREMRRRSEEGLPADVDYGE